MTIWGTTCFAAGTGLGLAARHTLALVADADPSLHAALWEMVAADAPLDEVLEGLSSRGLRGLPSFAIVRFEDDALARVVVRGAVTVTLQTVDGERCIDAGAVRTWVEDVVHGVTYVDLILDTEATELAFHLLAGAVPAGRMSRGLLEPDRHADEAVTAWMVPTALEPEPKPEPEPEPEPESAPVVVRAEPSRRSDLTMSVVEFDSLGSADEEDAADEVASLGSGKPMMGEQSDESEDYDFIFGRTTPRSVQLAAVHPVDPAADETAASLPDADPSALSAPPAPAAPRMVITGPIAATPGSFIDGIPGVGAGGTAAPSAQVVSSPFMASQALGDHDGRTVSRAQLAAMRGSPTPTSSAAPLVQALFCRSGHPNPPSAGSCRVCGANLADSVPTTASRPVLGTLHLSTGVVIVLDRPQLIGRNPKIEGNVGGELPNIVKIDHSGQGLSRRHASIRLEGWQVLIEDLNSANGTEVTLPGQPTRRLHAGEPVLLEPGTFVDLGGEVTFRYEVTA